MREFIVTFYYRRIMLSFTVLSALLCRALPQPKDINVAAKKWKLIHIVVEEDQIYKLLKL